MKFSNKRFEVSRSTKSVDKWEGIDKDIFWKSFPYYTSRITSNFMEDTFRRIIKGEIKEPKKPSDEKVLTGYDILDLSIERGQDIFEIVDKLTPDSMGKVTKISLEECNINDQTYLMAYGMDFSEEYYAYLYTKENLEPFLAKYNLLLSLKNEKAQKIEDIDKQIELLQQQKDQLK